MSKQTTIIDPSTFAPTGVTIAADATQEQWADIHRTILLCRSTSRLWLKQSREFAATKWGADYVAEVEIQMELSLGLPQPEPKPDINPADKSKGIVTIEGITQQFALWSRKMGPQIATWDVGKLKRALELLEPMEKQAQEIRARLNA
jgi:hypothetical protein